MKVKKSSIFLISAVILLCAAAPAFGQQLKHPDPSTFTRLSVVKPSNFTEAQKANISAQAQTGTTIPMWNYSILSPLDNNTYNGSMVGRNPMFNGHRGTTVQTYIVPVRLTFSDGTVFDPSVNDPCLPTPNGGTNSVISLIQGSPVFGATDWNLNGTDIGVTQYDDAYQRANFWKYVAPFSNAVTPYHTLLGYNVLPALQVTVPQANGYTFHDSCPYGIMDYNWFVGNVENTYISNLASQGVGPTNLPIFVFDSVVMYLNGNSQQCCALGAHGAYTNGSGLSQTYVVADYDSSSFWDFDVSTLSDEVGKWIDDPLIINAVPHFSWPTGNKEQSPCEAILEVGDPLTGYEIATTMPNGITYNPQELVFYSWFFDQNPSIGANGWYSFGNTESGPNTKVCTGNSNSTNIVPVTAARLSGALAR